YNPETRDYSIESGDRTLRVALDNLERGYQLDGEAGHISTFIDAVLSPPWPGRSWSDYSGSVYFSLMAKAGWPYREALTERVDRVPVHFDKTRNLVSGIFPMSLTTWSVTQSDVETAAIENLARALMASKLEHYETHGARLGFLETAIPFKTAL